MGNTPVQDKTFQVPTYDLTFADRNHDGKIDINREACAPVVDSKTGQETCRPLPKNDPEYREFKADLQSLNLDVSRPVPQRTLEGYVARIRKSQTVSSLDDMATNMRADTAQGNLEGLTKSLQKLNHAITRGVLDKSEDPQALRVSLIQARDMIVARLEGTSNKKEIFKLLAIGDAIEHASYRLSVNPEKYHFHEKFAEIRNRLQPRISIE